MSERKQYNGYDLHIADKPRRDMPEFLRRHDMLQPAELTLLSAPTNIKEELAGIRAQNIKTASSVFERNRVPVRGALRAIVGYAFDKFNLPKSGGVDIGSGATGEMVEELLPQSVTRSSWVQLEANPSAVSENQRRHPNSRIVEGSYLNMGVSGLDIVTGLSSLDATCFLDQAIEQVRSALKEGGYLLHVQDVRPGKGFGLREMAHMGHKPPFNAEIPKDVDDPLTYFTDRQKQKAVSVGELFRRNLGRTIENNSGMELLFNRWVTARKPIDGPPALWYFMNILLRAEYFPPETDQTEEVSAVVTVARKRGL